MIEIDSRGSMLMLRVALREHGTRALVRGIHEKLQAMCAKVVCSHESDQVCGEVAAHVLLAAANE